jgi:hypothetical protein
MPIKGEIYMAIIDEKLIPEDDWYLEWETDNKYVSGKKYGLCNILTGEEYNGNAESIAILQGGIYLLELMELNFGGYQYREILPSSYGNKGGVKSCGLDSDLRHSKGIALMKQSEDYLLCHSSEYTQETLGKLILEVGNAKHTKYSIGEYLSAMMNIHYQTVNRGYNLPKAFEIIEHHSPFIDRESNVRAHGSLCRFIQQ